MTASERRRVGQETAIVRAFCGRVAPKSLPSQHPHICLAPHGHVNDGLPHSCPIPCGHTWVDMSAEDAELLVALENQLNELRLAGIVVRNVSVMLSDPNGYGFTGNKRRFRIDGDLVHTEPEEPR